MPSVPPWWKRKDPPRTPPVQLIAFPSSPCCWASTPCPETGDNILSATQHAACMHSISTSPPSTFKFNGADGNLESYLLGVCWALRGAWHLIGSMSQPSPHHHFVAVSLWSLDTMAKPPPSVICQLPIGVATCVLYKSHQNYHRKHRGVWNQRTYEYQAGPAGSLRLLR